MNRFHASIFLLVALSIFVAAIKLQAQQPFQPGRPLGAPTQSPSPSGKPIQLRRVPTPTPIPAPERPHTVLPPVSPGLIASPDDAAHFLAGMPVPPDSPLAPFAQIPEWREHSAALEDRFIKLIPRFEVIRAWQAAYLPESSAPMPVAFYMFSGPDFLYADQFFPSASVYVLCGTEPIGPAPDPLRLRDMSSALLNLQNSMNSLLRFSFFITKDMKTDLQQELKGTLPIFYVLIARAGKTITDITFVSLNRNGTFQQTAPIKTGGTIPGVRISYIDNRTRNTQTMFYFTTDISNDGIKSNPGFLNFCQHFGVGSSLLKSSSYLLFENGFSTIRNFLLDHSTTIVQDDSGIPLPYFNRDKWNLRLFGTYIGPIDSFKQHYQPQLQELYRQSNPPPLEFGFGYRWNRTESNLVVAQRN